MKLPTRYGSRGRWRLRWLWCIGCLLYVALGCGDPNSIDESSRVVVQGLLVLGTTRQSVWVEWATPADSVFSANTRPVDAGVVHLALVTPDGEAIPFVAAAETPGRLDAQVTLAPGETYALNGQVNGTAVSSTTLVPSQLDILSPASDTVRVSTGSCFLSCELPYLWHAAGSNAYEYSQEGEMVGGIRGMVRDTAGVLALAPSPAGNSTRLTVLAYDSNAAAFLLGTIPQSSIQGAFGFFGSASFVEKVVVWE